MSFLQTIGQGIGNCLSQGAATLGKATGTVAACAAAQKAIYSAGEWVGKKASALSGGRATLNNLVPEAVKAPCRELGDFLLLKVTFPLSDKMPNVPAITRHLPGSEVSPVSHAALACPITEEVVYRLPVVFLFRAVDQIGFSSPVGMCIKAGATLASSVAFTYGHERASGVAPHNPGRALGLLASGIGYTLIATHFGFAIAVGAHILYNLSSYC